MSFDHVTNSRIVDAMQAFADYCAYRDQCQSHGFGWSNTDRASAGFVVSIWEKARRADLLIKAAGITGVTANTWLWADAVEIHLKAGHLGHCNVDLIRSLLAA